MVEAMYSWQEYYSILSVHSISENLFFLSIKIYNMQVLFECGEEYSEDSVFHRTTLDFSFLSYNLY